MTGVIGLVLFLGGLVLTFVGSEPAIPGFLPSLRGTWTALGHGLVTVTAGLLCSIIQKSLLTSRGVPNTK